MSYKCFILTKRKNTSGHIMLRLAVLLLRYALDKNVGQKDGRTNGRTETIPLFKFFKFKKGHNFVKTHDRIMGLGL
jgi:hypothetical protein